MSHLPHNHRLVSSEELIKTKSQNPTQGRRSKAEGNRRRWIRTLIQFLWIFSVFIWIWLPYLTSKVYMKNIVLDLWDDSSRIQFKEEYSNLLEEEKGVLNLTQLVWYGKIIKVEMWSSEFIRNVISPCYHQNLNLFKWQVRRNNRVEFQWNVDIIRIITQIFTTLQKFWSLDQPLHPVP